MRTVIATFFVDAGSALALAGSGRNWRSFARALGKAVAGPGLESPSWRLLLVDQRNHGKSTLRYENKRAQDMVVRR